MSDMEKKVTEEAEMPKDKKKKKKALIILLPILAVFLALVIAVAAFIGHKFSLIDFDDNESTTIDPTQEFVEGDDDKFDFGEMDDATGNDFREILKNWATNGGEKMSNRDIINVLLIGSDASSEEPGRANVTEKGNTDVMMLVSINQVNDTIKLVSLMRDSYTYMDQFDRYAKLNAACANGGPAYLVQTIENDYKIKIDGYAMVDFDSFTQVIDVLGGVNVDVPAYVANHLNNGVLKSNKMGSGKGILLDGEQALAFSRVRKTDANGDISRVARQRQVVNALIEKAKGATLSEINEVADVMLANVRTNISKKSIISYASKAVTEGWANYEITEITMPTPDTRYGYSSKSTAWIWVVDYPLAARKLQLELYGETNINLEEGNRKTAITVIGGYVSKNTTDN
ncbi:MAG: LCP family protein [Clostridia bacterium]|nr:LCP family protein [Clostridia bacterium]